MKVTPPSNIKAISKGIQTSKMLRSNKYICINIDPYIIANIASEKSRVSRDFFSLKGSPTKTPAENIAVVTETAIKQVS